jgi:hypothetical protein
MNELTLVDHAFELIGLRSAGKMWQTFDAFWIPGLIVLGSVAFVYWRSLEEGKIRPIVLYLFYAVVISAVWSPVSVKFPMLQGDSFSVPRVVYYADQACDRVIRGVSSNFQHLRTEMDRDQSCFMMTHVRIRDPKVRKASRVFIRDCLGPELAALDDEGRDISELLADPFRVEPLRVTHASTGDP